MGTDQQVTDEQLMKAWSGYYEIVEWRVVDDILPSEMMSRREIDEAQGILNEWLSYYEGETNELAQEVIHIAKKELLYLLNTYIEIEGDN